MSALLALAATASGALAGFAAGALWGAFRLPGASQPLAALVVAVALGLDVVGLPRPLAVGRQVPRSWARVLPLRVAAVLYGARLGVGPATILNTWLWWAAALLGAAAGPWWSTASGAAFGLARVLVMLSVSARVELDMAARMERVRLRERIGKPLSLAGAALAVAVLLVACTDDGGRDKAAKQGDERSSSTATVPPDSAPPPGPPVEESLLLDDVGAGYVRVPDDSRPGLGSIDLADAANAEADTAAERSLLATRGFRRGLARAWKTEAGDELYEAVYEFRDEAGAAAYMQDGMITLEGSGTERYPVDGVPGATGFSQAEPRPTGSVTSHAVVFVRGHRFFLVFAASARPGTTPGEVAAIARAADARQAQAQARAATTATTSP